MSRAALVSIARRAATKAAKPSSTSLRSAQSAVGCNAIRLFATNSPGLPDSVKRVGESFAFPNEHPGMNYEFNWSLNADGVTPLKGSAFRITKPLELKVAGLTPSSSSSSKIRAASASEMPEAGSPELSFEIFDEVAQRTKDLLSSSDALYVPEGHVPGSRVGVRIITNSATIAPSLLAYLDRAPKSKPSSQPITAYVLSGAGEEFAGYAIEEVDIQGEAKSVATVVVVGRDEPSLEKIAAGLETSVAGLVADEEERAEKKAAEE